MTFNGEEKQKVRFTLVKGYPQSRAGSTVPLYMWVDLQIFEIQELYLG